MKTSVFLFVIFISTLISCFAYENIPSNHFHAIDGNYTKITSIKSQGLDSVTGQGWDRVVYLVTTSVDTMEKSVFKIRFEQTEIKSAMRMFVDPRISNGDLSYFILFNDLVLFNDQGLKSEESIHYVPKFLWLYKDLTTTETKMVHSNDSLKLTVAHSTERQSADTIMFVIISLSLCSLAGFTMRRIIDAFDEDESGAIIISMLVALALLILGPSVGLIPLFSNLAGLIGYVVLFVAITILCFNAASTTDADGPNQNFSFFSTWLILLVVSVLVAAVINSLLVSIIIFGWFIFLYFLGYVLAFIITKLFPRKFKIATIKVFV